MNAVKVFIITPFTYIKFCFQRRKKSSIVNILHVLENNDPSQYMMQNQERQHTKDTLSKTIISIYCSSKIIIFLTCIIFLKWALFPFVFSYQYSTYIPKSFIPKSFHLLFLYFFLIRELIHINLNISAFAYVFLFNIVGFIHISSVTESDK